MHIAGLLLLVLLPPKDAIGDLATAVQQALQQELGDVTMAIAPDSVVTPAMWQGDDAPMHARFVAHLTWLGPNQASVDVRAASAPSAAHARTLSFAAQDGKAQRGRAVGLVVAELLRELPPAAFAGVPALAARKPEVARAPSRLVLGAMAAAEQVRSGTWALGPEVRYDLGLTQALRVQAAGTIAFASLDQYTDLDLGLGLYWDFLRTRDGRHALGVGADADLLRQSAGGAGEKAGGGTGDEVSVTAVQWSAGFGAYLSGRVTLWRSLRLVGEAGIKGIANSLTLTVGESEYASTATKHAFSRLRPSFALGLEVAL